jgi:hypothetical protein
LEEDMKTRRQGDKTNVFEYDGRRHENKKTRRQDDGI